MSDKYSGAFIPGVGGGGDEPPPPTRTYSGAFDWRRVRDEQKAQLAAWMNGREPREWWETYDCWENTEYGGFYEQKFFCMEFPTTVHYFVIAWERAPELGRLYVWCMGCKHDQCGACKWIRNAYVVAVKAEKALLFGHAKETDLPF